MSSLRPKMQRLVECALLQNGVKMAVRLIMKLKSMMSSKMKNLASQMRDALKSQSIKARVRVSPAGNALQVFTPTHEARFTPEQIGFICGQASWMGMTFVRGLPIDTEHQKKLTGKTLWEFYRYAI